MKKISVISLVLAMLLILPSIAMADLDKKGQKSISEKATLYSKDNNHNIEISVVSEKDANDIFDEMKEHRDIPFGFSIDGSYARAHKMTRIMDAMEVTSGKAFLEGELYFDDPEFGKVGLRYQVSPVVMVRQGDTLTPYVLDPALFKKPVSFQAMKEMFLANSKSKISREYFTNRFAYDLEDREKKLTDYDQEPLVDMEGANKKFSKALYMYKHMYKQLPEFQQLNDEGKHEALRQIR